MPQDKRYVVEGYWDCQYCENKGIRGRFKTCPHCGHPRDASVTFYTKEIGHDQAITDEEFARERAEADKNSRSSSAKAGEESIRASDEPSLYSRGAGEGRGTAEDAHDASDWLCDYCGSYNKAADLICAFCGAEREMSEGKTYELKFAKYNSTPDDATGDFDKLVSGTEFNIVRNTWYQYHVYKLSQHKIGVTLTVKPWYYVEHDPIVM